MWVGVNTNSCIYWICIPFFVMLDWIWNGPTSWWSSNLSDKTMASQTYSLEAFSIQRFPSPTPPTSNHLSKGPIDTTFCLKLKYKYFTFHLSNSGQHTTWQTWNEDTMNNFRLSVVILGSKHLYFLCLWFEVVLMMVGFLIMMTYVAKRHSC